MWNVVAAYLGLVALLSAASFAAYALDKRRATARGRRVPERTLHQLAMLGGWPGALFGQRYYRHKTQKVSFLVAFWAVALLHVALVGARNLDPPEVEFIRESGIRTDETAVECVLGEVDCVYVALDCDVFAPD